MKKQLLAVLAAVAMVGSGALAGPLVYEPFAYADGLAVADATDNGGSGLTGDWAFSQSSAASAGATTATYAAPGLSAGALAVGGHALHVHLENSASNYFVDINRSLSTSIGVATAENNDYFVSFIAEVDWASNAAGAAVMDFGNSVWIGKGSNTLNWSITDSGNPGGSYTVKTDVATSETAFIVVKFSQAGTGTLVEMFVNPDLSAEPALADASHTTTALETLSQLRSRFWTGYQVITADAWFDEVRVGETWADVTVPEPASLALLGLGLLGLRRRR